MDIHVLFLDHWLDRLRQRTDLPISKLLCSVRLTRLNKTSDELALIRKTDSRSLQDVSSMRKKISGHVEAYFIPFYSTYSWAEQEFWDEFYCRRHGCVFPSAGRLIASTYLAQLCQDWSQSRMSLDTDNKVIPNATHP